MTLDLVLPLAQFALVLFLALWLTIGAFENVVHPTLNETFTSQVLDMTHMREQFPEAYAAVAYRRVASPGLRRFLFRFIVTWEVTATVALWIGTVTVGLAMLGQMSPDVARGWAILGVLLFTTTWAGFLVAGNWFCYWFCHEGAQNTHYQMTLWGLATMIFLVVSG